MSPRSNSIIIKNLAEGGRNFTFN